MNTKALLFAAVLAVVLVLVGLLVTDSGDGSAKAGDNSTLLFPDLMEGINDAAALTITTSEGEFNAQRAGETWILAERDGYPVQMENVRATLIGLAELKTVEAKTSDSERYSKLGVQAVGAEPEAETQSKQVNVKDEGGAILAALIIGKPRSGGQGATFYARKPGEDASWLVEGKLPPLPASGDDWLDKKILELKRNDISGARTTHADGEILTISKSDGETDFTVHELPAERELKYASVANGIAGAMQYLNFEDVQKAESFEQPESPVAVTSLWTKDGLQVTTELWDIGEETFASFRAAYDLDGIPTVDLGPQPPLEEGEAQAKATPRPAAEVEAEVETLNAQLTPWIYKIATYSKENLTKRLEDQLKPLPEPEEEAPAEGDVPSIDAFGGPVEDEAAAPSIDDLGGAPADDEGDDG